MVARVPTRPLAAVLLVAGLLALTLAGPATPARAADADLDGARTVLQLSQQRLSFMRTVMAAKWASRAPIEDLAQEATVLDAARAAGAERGLSPETVAGVFAQEISAAKVVQLGWGSEWLLHGYPADEPVPDLAAVRPQIAALTPQIADALAAHRSPALRPPRPRTAAARGEGHRDRAVRDGARAPRPRRRDPAGPQRVAPRALLRRVDRPGRTAAAPASRREAVPTLFRGQGRPRRVQACWRSADRNPAVSISTRTQIFR